MYYVCINSVMCSAHIYTDSICLHQPHRAQTKHPLAHEMQLCNAPKNGGPEFNKIRAEFSLYGVLYPKHNLCNYTTLITSGPFISKYITTYNFSFT